MAGNYNYYADKESARLFLTQLMLDLTDEYNNAGIQDYQGIWVYHRFRKTSLTIPELGMTAEVSIPDLIAPFADVGAIYFIFSQMQPDDMTEPYHWLSQERIDSIRNKIGVFLGVEEPL